MRKDKTKNMIFALYCVFVASALIGFFVWLEVYSNKMKDQAPCYYFKGWSITEVPVRCINELSK